MTSLGSSSRLRTNCRMMLMRDKAFQEEQRKRQKMVSSPRGHSSFSRNHPPLNSACVAPVSGNSILLKGILSHNGSGSMDISSLNHRHLDPIASEDLTPVDSSYSPYSLTPSSMTTSISEYDAIFEDIGDIVEKDTTAEFANSSLPRKDNSPVKTEEPSKQPLKTSSSCPTIRASRLTLPSKLDPNDFPDIDSYKKEKHNIVEKKRRYKINDCIQELADLLPNSYDVDLNMKKGYILEKSVEYIQELKRDSEKKSDIEKRYREMEKENRQLLLELQALKRSQEAAILQQQQQQQQFLIVSSNYQQQHQPQISPQQNQIVLALADDFAGVSNQQGYDANHSIFIDDYSARNGDILDHPNIPLSVVMDADALMSNLQVSNELTDIDRQELNGFINLDEFSNGDEMMMNDFSFHNQLEHF